jgi:hypothetical protein
MFRLVADDPTVALDERQAARIRHLLLEFVPAQRCLAKLEPPMEIVVTGHYPPDLHLPLLQHIEAMAGTRFQVKVTNE